MPSNDKGHKAKKAYGLGQSGKPFEKDLPSGEVCLMKALTPDDLIKLGILDRIDSLTSIVATEHITRVTGTPQQRQEAAASALAKLDTDSTDGRKALLDIMRDRTKWETLQDFINVIVVAAVIEPALEPEPKDPEPREFGKLYPGDVDLADRMAIMQAAMEGMVGGVQAMEPFRKGSVEDVGYLPESLQVQHPTLSPGGGGN